MFGLVRRMTILGTTMLLLVSGSVLVGRAMPTYNVNPLKTYGVSTCDGRPCFEGVVPGVTMQSDPALEQLRQDGNCLPNSTVCYFPITENVRGLYNANAQTTLVLYTDQRVFSFQVDELVELYGAPCGIDVSFDNFQYRLLFPFVEAQGILESDARVRLSSKVEHVALLEFNPCEYEVIPWRGFTTVDRYRAVFSSLWMRPAQ